MSDARDRAHDPRPEPEEVSLTSPYLDGEGVQDPTQAMPAVDDEPDGDAADPHADSEGQRPALEAPGDQPARGAAARTADPDPDPEPTVPAAPAKAARPTPAKAARPTPAKATRPTAKPATGRARRVLRRTGRIVAAVGALALVGALTAGAGWLRPADTLSAGPLDVAVPASEVALACAGAIGSSSTGGSDAELSGASTVTGRTLAAVIARDGELAPATLGPLDGTATTALSEGTGVAVASLDLSPSATVLRAEPGVAAAWASAAVVQRADSGDVRGLAASSCPAAATTSWFVAGRTTVQSSAVLSLRNPGATPATVTLRAWGSTGPIPLDLPALVVAPGAEVAQVLEGIVPDVERLAFAVTATGGQVSATLQTSQLDGLTPGGIDLVVPSGLPSSDVLVPGVSLVETTVDEADPNLVRVLNPGDDPVTITVEIVGENSTLGLTPGGLVVEPGTVSDVSLAGAPSGTYTIRVTSSGPVVAGASVVRVGSPAPEDPDVPVADRAWISSVPPTAASGLVIPGLGEVVEAATLVLAHGGGLGSGPATVEITGFDADGNSLEPATLDISAASSLTLEIGTVLPGAVVLALSSDVPVSASAVLAASNELGELISVVTAQPDAQVERSAAIRVSLD